MNPVPEPVVHSGDDLRRLREAVALSQAQLAAQIGALESDVSEWERSPARPPKEVDDYFRSVAAELRNVVVGGDVKIGNVRADEIVGGAVIRGNASSITVVHGPIPNDTVDLLTYNQKLSEKEALVRSELEKVVQELRRRPKEVISSDQALVRIAEKTKFNVDQIQQNMDKARNESGQFFRVTLMFAGIGSAVIIAGAGLMMAGFSTAGLVTTAASLIPQATALLLFNKDKELRKTIETYHGQILESQKVLTMIDLAETMNENSKDTVKEQIVLAVLKASPPKASARNASGTRTSSQKS